MLDNSRPEAELNLTQSIKSDPVSSYIRLIRAYDYLKSNHGIITMIR